MSGSKRRRFFVLKDGRKAQVLEATYPMDVKIYKSDRRKAIWSDPYKCIISLGMKRLPSVIEAFVGQGKDAYLVIENGGKLVAWHFFIGASARSILDNFDGKGSPKTQTVTLRVPPRSLKLAYRRKSNARRRAEVRSGTGKPVTNRVRRAARMERLVHNVIQRERPKIVVDQI